MENQVQALKARNLPVGILGASQSASNNNSIVDDLKQPQPRLKLVYVTPEGLSSQAFKDILTRLHSKKLLSFLAVDV